ncbi:MAG: hypothetical protein J7L54_01540 [Elusimicrobia bacterium]|nr:hypothetical protein [Elusimicrobiota bacterium]
MKNNKEEDIASIFRKSYDIMKRKNIREFKLSKKDFSISIKRAAKSDAAESASRGKSAERKISVPPSEDKREFIKSPLAGVFYKSPSPNSKPYISPPCAVKKGQPLCIVEAMKVMNEIESPFPCEVLRFTAENGQAVKKDDPLFEIRKKSE